MKKRNRFLLWAISFMLLFTGCGKSIEQQIAEQLELGQKYLLEENYEEAIVAFGKVIELEPKEIQAYTGLAAAYIETDERKMAEEVLDQGFAIVDSLSEEERTEDLLQNIESMTALALGNYEELLKLSQENIPESIKYYKKILALDGSRAEMYEELARLYVIEGDYEKTEEVLDEGILATGDERLEEYKNHLETERTIVEQYNEAVENMVQYLQEHEGELSEEVLIKEDFQDLVQRLEEPLIREYGEKYIGIYPSGYIYYGDMKDGKREGHGSWIRCGVRNGGYDKFEGEWREDYPNGEGMNIWKNFNPTQDRPEYTEEKGNFVDGYLDGAVVYALVHKGERETYHYNVNYGKAVILKYENDEEVGSLCVIAYSEEFGSDRSLVKHEGSICGVEGAMKQ